jgi:predicted peptidase
MFERAAGAAMLLAAAVLRAQAGPQVLTVVSTVDGSLQPYALYLPPGFDPQKEYPLLLSLHSEESNHRLNLSQVLGIAG